jgi:hypothetical protein
MRLLKFIVGIFLIISGNHLFSQKTNFQQEVNTVINVKLDDVGNRLTGTVFTEYTNHSPHALDTIYFHLWANAYKNNKSAFSKQQIANKDVNFYFSPDSLRGGYEKLDFFIGGKKVKWHYSDEGEDIAVVIPDNPAEPGETIHFSIPFELKIPGSFSRMGHEGQSYQVTQWFPKPAVFDKNGWHKMPYLNMGEFYSEFGNYDVTITLPSNYFVAATGELLTNSELDRIEQRVIQSNLLSDSLFSKKEILESYPVSDPGFKSIRYIADNVHDFAWFADKRFLIREKQIEIDSGKVVKGQIFYLPEGHDIWKNGLDYVERGVKFYSQKVGNYPYPKVAAVQGGLKAGGGMEYPMVTVISELGDAQALDKVITHEIGHNWFYGILASDERRYPWLDEGLTSYYEFRYSKTYYSKNETSVVLPAFIDKISNRDWYSFYHDMTNKRALSQPSDLHSTAYTFNNYFLAAYQNPTMAFNYLANYIGEDNFDRIIQSFYKNYAFRHFGPEDFRKHLETASGLNLDWFFDGMISDTRVFDYNISSIRQSAHGYELKIKNNTAYEIPFQLTAIKHNSIYETIWIKGFCKDSLIIFTGDSIDQFTIDYHQLYSDNNRTSNSIFTGAFNFLPIRSKPRLQFFNLIDDYDQLELGWLPSIGWNKSDGVMLGLMLYNSSLPSKRFEFFLHPMYSTGKGMNERIVGQGKLSYNWYRNSTLRHTRIFTSGKSFHYQSYTNKVFLYRQMKAGFEFRFNRSLIDKKYTDLTISFTNFLKEHVGETDVFQSHGRAINFILDRADQQVLLPRNWKINLEFADFLYSQFSEDNRYAKLDAEFSLGFMYSKNKTIDFRVYGGTYIWQQNPISSSIRPGTLSLIGSGATDYFFDDYFFDRGALNGFWSQQLNMTGGGFKTAIGSSSVIGYSNQYVAAINLKANLPLNTPVIKHIKPFFDMGIYGYLPNLSDKYSTRFLYSGGFLIESFEGILNIYLPLANSAEIEELFRKKDSFFNRFSFSLNLKLFDISKLMDREDLLYAQ